MAGVVDEFAAPPPPPPLPPAPPERSSRGLRTTLVVGAVVFVTVLLWNPVVHGLLGGGRSYEFIAVDPANGDPVTWDHCLAIRYQVNPEGGPENWREIVDGAFEDIEEHSGFVFVDAGVTANRTLAGTFTPGATRGEPILIIWSSQGRLHSLQGNTVGLGGGGVTEVNGRKRIVTGRIALDREAHSRTYDPMPTNEQRLILEHEIGHVLGLDHTDDPRQLMAASYTGQDGLGEGDVNGLQKLHEVPCG
jgi:hypothetical protein